MMRSSQGSRTQTLVETLEARQLFSVSVPTLASPAVVSAISPAVHLRLGPSAVEGTYKGDTQGSTGAIYEIKVVISATSVKLTVEGLGTYAAKITSKQLLKIREGTFDIAFKYVSGTKGDATFTGTVKDSGLKITGDYVNSAGKSGTFILKKA